MNYNPIPYRRLGTMIDCSRNAVMKVETLKKWIDITSDLGFNCVMLYMEDTYEVNNNPYFGLGRGRYSKAELKEINDYALTKGVELIPCIQTLAHLNALVDWPYYGDIVDCNDIILVGDEKVYELIDNMFASLSECLTTKHINIGMDEAHMITRGKYYDLHGDCDRTAVLVEHIKRVAEIGAKYGFTLSMWSDMFFRIASNGSYYNTNFKVSDDFKKLIPENVDLVYWDYYHKDKNHYDKMLKAHNKMKDSTWFAGGLWTWTGFAPNNTFSIQSSKCALQSCEKNGIKDIFFTLWGDDSAECSKFSTLPALFYVSEFIKGNRSLKSIKEKFKAKYNISFDRFMLLDLTNGGKPINPSKYIFYNDLFNGRMDSLILDGTAETHKKLARKLNLVKNNEEWGYLFATLGALSETVALKADLGFKIREAYSNRDINAFKSLIKDCKKLIKQAKVFYNNFRNQWLLENKSNGFDVQNIRVGGYIARLEHCTKMLQDFVDGKIDRIDELEEERLDLLGRGNDFVKEDIFFNSFRRTFTANVLSH